MTSPRAFRLPLLLTLTAPMLLAACSSTSDTSPATAVDTCTMHLAPSADDQTAVQTALIEAAPGSVVCLDAGTFAFNTEVSVTQADITIRGAGQGKTVLDFSQQDTGANGVLIKGDGATLEDFDVKNTPGDGIRADSVDGITFRRVSVLWDKQASLENGAYGLYPVASNNVTIDGCLVSGARDAGVYVGQSTNILVKDSEATGNVAGIEIENSTDAEVVNNHAHDNTGGILIFNLPGLPVQDGKRSNVHGNLVENNNVPNFGDPASVVAKVPNGTGIMILASDDNEIWDNDIQGNGSAALLVVSYLEALFGMTTDAAYDHYPQGNYLHDNRFSENGKSPAPLIIGNVSPAPVPDILWDGCEDAAAPDGKALVNCVSNNGEATYLNFDICNTPPNKSTDIAAVTCTYDPLSSTK